CAQLATSPDRTIRPFPFTSDQSEDYLALARLSIPAFHPSAASISAKTMRKRRAGMPLFDLAFQAAIITARRTDVVGHGLSNSQSPINPMTANNMATVIERGH